MLKSVSKNQFFIYRIVFATALIFLVFISSVAFLKIRDLDKSSEYVIQTHEVNLQLEQIISYLKDAETGERGFLITRDSSFLKPYLQSYKPINKTLADLKFLLRDNPKQLQNLDLLFSLVTHRLNVIAEVLQQDARNAVRQETIKDIERGKTLMDNIRILVDEMRAEEKTLLTQRQATLKENVLYAPLASFILFLFTISILILSYFKVNNDFEQQQALLNEINVQNRTFNHAEKSSEQGTYSWNLKTGKITFSDNLFRLLGCEPKSFEPCLDDFYKFVHPDDAGLAFDYYNNKDSKDLRTVEYRINIQTGETKYLRGITLLNDTPQGATLVGTLQDITKEKIANQKLELYTSTIQKVNEELEETQIFLNSLINLLPNGISIYEAVRNEQDEIVDFSIKFLNTVSIDIINKPYNELVGKSVMEVYSGIVQSGYFDKLKNVVETGEPLNFVIYYDYPEIEPGWFHNIMAKMGDGVMVTYMDVTEFNQQKHEIEKINIELERKNIELIKNNTELTSFNHIASHDLQEPLRKINTFISRLKDSDESNLSEQGKQYFDRIVNAATRMQKLITDLLVFSNTSSSNKKFEAVDLNLILQSVMHDLTELSKGAEANIKIENLPVVNGVEFQFHQLFMNLLSNAIKYSKPNQIPEVQITYNIVQKSQIETTEELIADTYHHIAIADNGIGFKEIYADKIFKLFQRLHDKTQYEGTGIGLAICKKIVDNHNGHMTVNSTEGVGSTFHVYLPA
jgi:signal transduction histidine kinase/CHASE3 domain sensor protein